MAPSPKPRVLPPGVAHARRSALLTLAALITAGSPLPFTAAAMIPLGWAGVESVLSIRARATAPRTAPGRTRGIVSSVIGLVLVCLLSLVVLLPYAFYSTAKDLQDCRLGANTAIAAADCSSRFNAGLESILGGFLSSGRRGGG